MRLVIGYDGSDHADVAIDDLRQAGLPAKADAMVVTVLQRWLPPSESEEQGYPARWTDAATESAEHLSMRAADRLRSTFPSWSTKAKVAVGSPAPALLRICKEESADLLVVGSQGRTALRGRFFGSVSQSVSGAAPCSVRIGRKCLSGLTQPRLVIAVDGSTTSALAVSEVARRRWLAGTHVRVVGVVEAWKEFHDDWKRWQKTWLMQKTSLAAEELERAGLTVSVSIQQGDPKRTILRDAKRWGAQCIFVGSTGLSPEERLFVGSVSQAIVSRAHCSVEVVRHRAYEIGSGYPTQDRRPL
jgi:nucleotide-binding universal stress UspA family protein